MHVFLDPGPSYAKEIMGHGGNLELKREAKSKTTFTDQTSAVSHFWIESEDQLGVKVNIFTNVTSEFRSLCVQTL